MGQRAWITKPTSKRREICGSRVEEIRAVCYCWICRCFIIQGLVWTERREERSRRLCAIMGGGVLRTRRTEDVTRSARLDGSLVVGGGVVGEFSRLVRWST